jgi:ankyrin repeat protein
MSINPIYTGPPQPLPPPPQIVHATAQQQIPRTGLQESPEVGYPRYLFCGCRIEDSASFRGRHVTDLTQRQPPLQNAFKNLQISPPNPLKEAFRKGNQQEILQLLASPQVDLQFTVGLTETPPLHFAVFMGWTEVVKRLIALQVDVNARANGNTPLLTACTFTKIDEEIVMALLEAGADPNAQDSEDFSRETVFYKMCLQGVSEKVLNTCLEKGANINARSVQDKTILESLWSIVYRNDLSLEEQQALESRLLWVLEAGGRPNAVDASTIATEIQEATAFIKTPAIRNKIIQKLMTLCSRDKEGNTLLHWLVLNDKFDLLKVIWQAGQIPDVLARNHQGVSFVDIFLAKAYAAQLLHQYLNLHQYTPLREFSDLLYAPFDRPQPPSGLSNGDTGTALLEILAKSHSGNPLEPLFILSLLEVARPLEARLGRKRFLEQCKTLAKRFPSSATLGHMLEPVDRFQYDTIYTIHRGHLDSKKFHQPIPPLPSNAEPQVFLREIETLFGKINMTDNKKPDYIPPEKFGIPDQKAGLGYCQKLIQNLQGNLPGLAKDSEKYGQIHAALYHILKTIGTYNLATKEGYSQFVEAMHDLCALWSVCGPATYAEVIDLYLKIVKGEALSFENVLFRNVSQMRRDMVCNLIGDFIPNLQTRHDYIAIAKTHPELGLPEVEFVANLTDVFANCLTPTQHPQIVTNFWNHYTPSALIEYVWSAFLLDEKNRCLFIDWCKAHIPAQFVGTSPKDRPVEYLAQVIYDEKGNIRVEAVIDVLLQIGVLADPGKAVLPRIEDDEKKESK